MNANQVKQLVTKVPTIRRSIDLKSFDVSHTTIDRLTKIVLFDRRPRELTFD